MKDTESARDRIKVAILGGGVGGLSAAWALTEPERRDRYEVTVYQMGWRLGGKGASGRNLARRKRIEEHGLHMWFGFYENAFRIMKACYERWQAIRPDCPIKNCLDDAFLPHHDYVLNEHGSEGRWRQWPLDLPTSALSPGDGQRVGFLASLAFAKINGLVQSARQYEQQEGVQQLEGMAAGRPAPVPLDAADRRILESIRRRYAPAESGLEGARAPLPAATLLGAARDLLADDGPAREILRELEIESPLEARGDGLRRWRFQTAVGIAARCFQWSSELLRAVHRARPDIESVRRLAMSVDFAAALLSGLSKDILGGRKRFKDLDEKDFAKWLADHGANRELLASNPLVRFTYSVVFAFVDGDPARPSLAAGAALQGLLRLFLNYKGALAYRMASGMGDIVFSPLHDVLKERGVRFQFFHRVDDIVMGSEDGHPVVEAVNLTRQVELKHTNYDPLIDAGGFPAWPSEPIFDQIREGEELRARLSTGKLNLEAPRERTEGWRGERKVRLERRRPGHPADSGFDHVVLAIPVAALRAITQSFLPQDAFGQRWAEMLEKVQTVPTQAMQLWLKSPLQELTGRPGSPVWGTYVEPMDTYADMTPALKLEDPDPDIKQLAYFCGALPFVGEDHQAALAQVRAIGRTLFQQHAHAFWPKVATGAAVRWDVLHAFSRRPAPEDNLEDQYFRANILPSERFSASFPGTTKHRLPPALPEVPNLFLAGDWTDNPLNVGCVEATVMSGLLAARALSGDEGIVVSGEEDDYLWLGAG